MGSKKWHFNGVIMRGWFFHGKTQIERNGQNKLKWVAIIDKTGVYPLPRSPTVRNLRLCDNY